MERKGSLPNSSNADSSPFFTNANARAARTVRCRDLEHWMEKQKIIFWRWPGFSIRIMNSTALFTASQTSSYGVLEQESEWRKDGGKRQSDAVVQEGIESQYKGWMGLSSSSNLHTSQISSFNFSIFMYASHVLNTFFLLVVKFISRKETKIIIMKGKLSF